METELRLHGTEVGLGHWSGISLNEIGRSEKVLSRGNAVFVLTSAKGPSTPILGNCERPIIQEKWLAGAE